MPYELLLSILIPTYNRSTLLYKNLCITRSILSDNNLKNEIEIIISDNNSEDNTFNMINSFDFNYLNYRLYSQKQNMGPIFNCLFLLKKAKGKFIMYLGDDDYLDEEYLNYILPKLKTDGSIFCVIPATKSLFQSGEIKPGRDYNKISKLYCKGFRNCLENSWRGTQLSAIIHYRKDLYETYLNQKVNNLYPFVFFVSYNSLRGKTWHMTKYPVTITQMEVSVNVDYGSANLIPDIFDNYKKLPGISYIQRILLEVKLLKEQPWRYLEYFIKKGIKGLLNCIITLSLDKSTSLFTKILFPFIIFIEIMTLIFRKIFNCFTPL
jgi:glycosyltransferase involved in cell wall biosynthesis